MQNSTVFVLTTWWQASSTYDNDWMESFSWWSVVSGFVTKIWLYIFPI